MAGASLGLVARAGAEEPFLNFGAELPHAPERTGSSGGHIPARPGVSLPVND